MSRFISLLLASILALQLFLAPENIKIHSLLPFLAVGTVIGFFHAAGFSPNNPIRKHLLGPTVAWPIMAFGIWQMFSQLGFI